MGTRDYRTVGVTEDEPCAREETLRQLVLRLMQGLAELHDKVDGLHHRVQQLETTLEQRLG